MFWLIIIRYPYNLINTSVFNHTKLPTSGSFFVSYTKINSFFLTIPFSLPIHYFYSNSLFPTCSIFISDPLFSSNSLIPTACSFFSIHLLRLIHSFLPIPFSIPIHILRLIHSFLLIHFFSFNTLFPTCFLYPNVQKNTQANIDLY